MRWGTTRRRWLLLGEPFFFIFFDSFVRGERCEGRDAVGMESWNDGGGAA